MKDIENRNDITELLKRFYGKGLEDKAIGFYFTEVVNLNMEHHLPKITGFWETVLFAKANYKTNVMEVHKHINQKHKIEQQHLERWVLLFKTSVDEMFAGTNAEIAKQRAQSIATLMSVKIVYG